MGTKTPFATGLPRPGAPTFTVSRVTVTSAAIQLVAANADRRTVIFIKTNNRDLFLGPDSFVTTLTGALFGGSKGAAFGLDTSDAVFAIAAAGSNEVHIIELIEV